MTSVSGGAQPRRSQKFVLGADNRGAEGAEIETTKASRSEGMGERVSPPQPYKLPSGAAPKTNFGVFRA